MAVEHEVDRLVLAEAVDGGPGSTRLDDTFDGSTLLVNGTDLDSVDPASQFVGLPALSSAYDLQRLIREIACDEASPAPRYSCSLVLNRGYSGAPGERVRAYEACVGRVLAPRSVAESWSGLTTLEFLAIVSRPVRRRCKRVLPDQHTRRPALLGTTAESRLVDLVCDLFDAEEFRAFLRSRRTWQPLLRNLPSGQASLELLVSDAIALLRRRGLLDSDFWLELVHERPRARARIVTLCAELSPDSVARLAGGEESLRPSTARRRFRPLAVALPLFVALAGLMLFADSVMDEQSRRYLPVEPPPGMKLVAGGVLLQGSSESEWTAAHEACRGAVRVPDACRVSTWRREEDVHREVVVAPFYMDVHETTARQVAAWLSELLLRGDVSVRGDFVLTREGRIWGKTREDGSANNPAIALMTVSPDGSLSVLPGSGDAPAALVTWALADAYCRARGGRLPTEAEWEWASRGPQRAPFPWGYEQTPECFHVVVDRVRTGRCQALRGADDVARARLDVSWAGIRDLGGNVSEWVEDGHVDSAALPSDASRCVLGPVSDGKWRNCKLFKGGSWRWPTVFARGAARSVGDSTPSEPESAGGRKLYFVDVGFRCAMDATGRTESP